VRGEIGQRDFSDALRHFHIGRQVLRDRIVERDFAALHGVGKQQRREDFCH
jgi:hypothetical protein